MSIEQEVIEKRPMESPKRFLDHHDYDPLGDARLQKGKEFLREAGIFGRFVGLMLKIKKEFPDAVFIEADVAEDGEVYSGLRWNFRQEEKDGESLPFCSTMEVVTRRDTRELAVITGEGTEILDELQWRDERVLDDVFEQGYKKPHKSLLIQKYRKQMEEKLKAV